MCRGVTEEDARGRMEMEADDPEKLERFFFFHLHVKLCSAHKAKTL